MSTLDEIRRWLSGESIEGFPARDGSKQEGLLGIRYLFNSCKYSEDGRDAWFIGGLLDGETISKLNDTPLLILYNIIALDERGKNPISAPARLLQLQVVGRGLRRKADPLNFLPRHIGIKDEIGRAEMIDELIRELRNELGK